MARPARFELATYGFVVRKKALFQDPAVSKPSKNLLDFQDFIRHI
mgnify:CR=1 FL=1